MFPCIVISHFNYYHFNSILNMSSLDNLVVYLLNSIIMSKNELRHRLKTKQRGALSSNGPDNTNWPYAHGRMDPYAKVIGISVLVITSSLIGIFRYRQYLRDIVVTPLDSPRIILDNSSSPDVNPERFWGTYRYFFI